MRNVGGTAGGVPRNELVEFLGFALAVDEVIKIRNVKVTSSVSLRLPPSPSGEGLGRLGYISQAEVGKELFCRFDILITELSRGFGLV